MKAVFIFKLVFLVFFVLLFLVCSMKSQNFLIRFMQKEGQKTFLLLYNIDYIKNPFAEYGKGISFNDQKPYGVWWI